jgi:hypothetical protein
MRILREAGHLLRFAGIFIAGTLLFVGIRGWLVPKSFGQYGHYRGDAISEIAAKPIQFAGRQACKTCHVDIAEKAKHGKHVSIGCETCHGVLANHADDPSVQPIKLDTAQLCVRCHEASAARPKAFPQVASADHANGLACETCHQPHNPVMQAGDAKTAGGAK